MYSLPVKEIDGIPIHVNIVPKGNYRVRPAYPMIPTSIAIHNTGNKGKGADAEAHNRLLVNKSKKAEEDTRWASYQFVVDDKGIYQNIPLNESAWHTGDGSGVLSGNRTAIGIEICENSDGDYAKAEANAVKLVAYLMKVFKMSISQVKPHQAYSGKYCPHIILSRNGGFSTFTTAVLKVVAGNEVVIKDDGKHVSPNDKDVDRVNDSFIGRRVESIYKGEDELNFYSKPSFNKKYKVGTIGFGIGFPKVLDKVNNGDMYKVENSKGAVFYITASDSFVKLEGEAKAPVKPNKQILNGIEVKGHIKVDKVNNFTYIYSKTSDRSNRVGKAQKDVVLPIHGSVPNWFEVIHEGRLAYVKAKYCSRA